MLYASLLTAYLLSLYIYTYNSPYISLSVALRCCYSSFIFDMRAQLHRLSSYIYVCVCVFAKRLIFACDLYVSDSTRRSLC